MRYLFIDDIPYGTFTPEIESLLLSFKTSGGSNLYFDIITRSLLPGFCWVEVEIVTPTGAGKLDPEIDSFRYRISIQCDRSVPYTPQRISDYQYHEKSTIRGEWKTYNREANTKSNANFYTPRGL